MDSNFPTRCAYVFDYALALKKTSTCNYQTVAIGYDSVPEICTSFLN